MIAGIKKRDNGEQRMVWAEVYAPNIPDSDGDFMDADGIRQAAYKFMKDLNLRKIDVQHDNNEVDGACVVESFIAREGDPDFIPGSWVVGMHVNNDEVWKAIKAGEINGFSMEALVTRVPHDIIIDIPPVITGKTELVEDHQHEFYVTYDPEGNLIGGTTNTVKGHCHTIRSGTITDKVHNHQHRFSFVEGFGNVASQIAALA